MPLQGLPGATAHQHRSISIGRGDRAVDPLPSDPAQGRARPSSRPARVWRWAAVAGRFGAGRKAGSGRLISQEARDALQDL